MWDARGVFSTGSIHNAGTSLRFRQDATELGFGADFIIVRSETPTARLERIGLVENYLGLVLHIVRER